MLQLFLWMINMLAATLHVFPINMLAVTLHVLSFITLLLVRTIGARTF